MALQQHVSTRSRPAFSGLRVSHAAARPVVMSRRGAGGNSVSVKAMIREWPDKDFIAETLSIFPDEGVANAEQARCLYSNGGYTYLDVRSALEVEEVGKVKDSVNIPFVICTRVWDPQEQKKVVKKENNNDFIAQVQRKFPNKDAKLLVACSNGTQYSIDALEALDEAGYHNLVGLRGGYTAWFRTWDNKLQRRRFGEYEENYSHDGDSGGIHASGAGFDRVDKIESWRPPVY